VTAARLASRRQRRTALALACIGLVTVLAAATARAAARAPAAARRGMVVTADARATQAGVAMLREGGNAIDAAVAAAFALSVVEPYHGGLGGGGFLLIRRAEGEVVAIDARETAPAAAHRDLYVEAGVAEDASRVGALAVGTPGFVLGLGVALARYGTMSLGDVLEPAIQFAQQGVAIGPRHAAVLGFWKQRGLAERFPETAAIQLPPAEAAVEPGWRLVQRDLAGTLKRLATQGPDVFYRGSIAAAIAAEMKQRGGILTREDLAGYEVKLREPLRGSYRGLEVISFPPPSSGGVALIEMLNILEGFELAGLGPGSSEAIHTVAEAMKLAFADRAAYLGDTDFVDVPVVGLIAKDYAAGLRARINPRWYRRAPWSWHRGRVVIRVKGPGEPAGEGGTTHLSATDEAGNAVAITHSINTLFGSGITVRGTGIVLNNQMDDFSIAPNRPNAYGLVDTRGANAVAPGKRPLSSMSPTIVLRHGKPYLVLGSPGGPRIITTVLQTLLNVVDWGMDISQAVSAPRFHHQWLPDKLFVEPAVPRDVLERLRAHGHHVEAAKRNWSSAQSIRIDPESGWHRGGSDPRSDGLALGY
jgi:gamma-glutamyltranspeptidase/glutathione hydrolase